MAANRRTCIIAVLTMSSGRSPPGAKSLVGNFGNNVIDSKASNETRKSVRSKMGEVDIDILTMEQYLALTRGNQAPSVNDDTHEHVERVLDNASLFNTLGVTHDTVMLRVLRITLIGAAKRWFGRIPSGIINTWGLLKNSFIQRYCPSSKTAKELEEIHNFKQEGDETLYQAWERYSDLLDKLAHLDKDCPLNEEVKRVEEVKDGEFGRSFPNNGGNGGRYRVGPPGYNTRMDNRTPFSERKPSLEELMNKHIEELTRRRNENEEWMKASGNHKYEYKEPECRIKESGDTVFADNKAPCDETSSNGTNKLHGVSFIYDDNVHVSKKKDKGPSGVLPCQLPPKELSLRSFTLPCTIGGLNMYALGQFTERKEKTRMVEPRMATLRLYSCRPIRMIGNDTCKFWHTCDPNLKDCNEGDSIYGVDKRGVVKQWYCYRDNER
ncbi:MAK10-like protein [Tanacetum coccineum]|uniref:MAK10-like protein n=1 Tax=Tanacetum coccineum TaxID=301880 RepID=A0ABQ5BH79_9ASTR